MPLTHCRGLACSEVRAAKNAEYKDTWLEFMRRGNVRKAATTSTQVRRSYLPPSTAPLTSAPYPFPSSFPVPPQLVFGSPQGSRCVNDVFNVCYASSRLENPLEEEIAEEKETQEVTATQPE